jgi:class 3 adenylate cyclase/predicted ATPase
MTEQRTIETGIAALEAQRAQLGDAVVDMAVAPLRARLAALSAPATAALDVEQTLKQVTVLFLDVVGSTALSSTLDPEDVYEVMEGTLARCTQIVEAHQGRVLQYAGDSILAAFGAENAREDDSERAVHAGLALLAEGLQLGEEVRLQHGYEGFNVRVGLNTGPVLLGGGVDSRGGIRGMTVNIAARMEQTAPAGGLRISLDTYRQVRGVFDVEPQAPIQVKGFDDPIVTYLVRRAKPRAFRVSTRGIEGVETRMVGRDVELELLQQAFRDLYIRSELCAVTVVADAGIGKSRLLYEFENWAEDRPEEFYHFQGRAQPQTQSQPYGLLRDILAWRLQISDSDSMETARQKIEQGIIPLFAPDDGRELAKAHADALGHLIGLDLTDRREGGGIRDDNRQLRNRGFHVAAQMFRRIAAQDGAPIILMLEDLHWADESSLDFLDYMTQVNRDVPMLLLALTRPTLFERRAHWSSVEGIHRRIDLRALDKGCSRQLADELLKKLPKIPAALRELVTGGAEGNPFYMEELVKMLVDEGAIDIRDERWNVVADKFLATRVPQTLTGVLQARLDSLEESERLALQQASVIGAVFWDKALSAIDDRASEALPALVQRELVQLRQDSSMEGMREYVFRHHILHQVTYDTLLRRTRREYHARVAVWLSGLSGVRANDFLGAMAGHFEKGGEIAKACEYFARAAEHAGGRHAHEATLGYVATTMALIDGAGADMAGDARLLRWRLLDVRERTLDLQGRRDLQRADIEALDELADQLDDDHRRGEVAWRRTDIALRTADYHAQENAARQAMALAERSGNGGLRQRAGYYLAVALSYLGRFDEAKTIAQAGLAAAQDEGSRFLESRFLTALAIIAGLQDDLAALLNSARQALLIDRERGDLRSVATQLCNLGEAFLRLGDQTQARLHLEESLRLHRAVGNRAMETDTLNNLSILALQERNGQLARTQAQAALDLAIAVQDPQSEAYALCCLGDAESALGNLVEAQESFERALALARQIDDPCRLDAAAGLARVALLRDDPAAAAQASEGLLIHLAGGGTLEGTRGPRLIRLSCYQVLDKAGDPRALDVLRAAYAELQARAITLADPVPRQCFLNQIHEHREIVAAWERESV